MMKTQQAGSLHRLRFPERLGKRERTGTTGTGAIIREVAARDAPTRLAVIDDIAVTRVGLREELRSAGFESMAYASVSEYLARVDDDPVPLIVCDLYLAGEGGPPAFDVISQLTEGGHRVVVYSTWALDPDVLQAIDRGAVGFVQKSATIDPLVAVLRRATTSDQDAGPVVTPEVAAAVRRRQRFGLTAAESEVLALVGQHLTNAEIARLRFVSEDTIKTQLASIRGKLGATNRAAAVRTGHTYGLIGRWKRTDARS